MRAILAKLVGAALFAASFGRLGAGLVFAGGLGMLFVGRRALRPSAALVAAGAAALGAHLALVRFDPHHDLPLALGLAGAAVLGAVLGLAAPRAAMVVSGAIFAFALTPWLGRPLGLDRDLVILGTTCLGIILPAVFWHALPTTVPPFAGAAVATLGAWAFVGASGVSPALFRLPVAWLAVFGVLAVVGFAAARAADARRLARAQVRSQKAQADEKKRRAADERARYARYFE